MPTRCSLGSASPRFTAVPAKFQGMPNYAVQIGLWPTSNLPADVVSNTWSCEADDDTAALDFANVVIDEYQANYLFFPNTIRQNGHTVKIYDRADAPPRVPVTDTTWNLTGAPTADAAPPEIALCLSFQGVPESGVSQARKRGRIFFGPNRLPSLGTNGRPTSALVTALVGIGQNILDASDAAADYTWTVYSSSTGDSFPVANGWVDDEFDIQRRRGRLAQARTTFS